MGGRINARWLSLRLLDYDKSLLEELNVYLEEDILEDKRVKEALAQAKVILKEHGISTERLKDKVVASIVSTADRLPRIQSYIIRAIIMKWIDGLRKYLPANGLDIQL